MRSPAHPVTVLIVDDSAITRRALALTFQGDPRFQVVAEAANGKEAIELAGRLHPMVITMDLEMPIVDGLEAIETIMARSPTRILVVTGRPGYRGLDASFEALERGALELVPKPTAWPGTPEEQERLRSLALMISTVPVLPHVDASRKLRQAAREAPAAAAREPLAAAREIALIAIGASTGGPSVLKMLLRELPRDLGVPIVIVQHLADVHAQGFIRWLGDGCRIQVCEGIPGTRLEAGTAYVAIRGPHVTVSPRGWLEADHEPPRGGNRPAIDVLFESVARNLGDRAVGVLLTGMGRDGARGLLELRAAGSVTLAQDEATSTVFGMPRAALELGAARSAVARDQLATVLTHLVQGHARA